MNWRTDARRRHIRLALASIALLVFALIYKECHLGDPEIALKIGEPWEDMRQRSSARIDPATPDVVSFNIPKSDARLRFTDPQYGFMTPPARFFAIIFNNERISSLRMSPQIEPLLLDDTLKVVLDLQEQWRNAGWRPIYVEDSPSFADTPQWRARLRDEKKNGGVAYWKAGDQYRAMLVVGRFHDDKRPTEERYLITLELAKWRD
ncbi:hypothetical protein [Pseudomonas sp. DSP3-2-2]|uniref:hypothetical protein n=1 Tax=unclassified Pseudomonas TaxID=196821 RepID=UPI003CE6B613